MERPSSPPAVSLSSRVLQGDSLLRLVSRRLRNVAIVWLLVVSVAVPGYVVIAGLDWFDALYMTIITLGTVGYGEVGDLGHTGRWWTMAVIVACLGTFVYTAAVLTTLFVSGEMGEAVRRRQGKKMRDGLSDHVVVVGFGRVGRGTVRGVRREGRDVLVVDRREDLGAAVATSGAHLLVGDATEEEVLVEAGIRRAAALIAAAHDDATNLVVVLTARALRPDLRIVARVNEPTWQDRIRRAGADVVVSPYEAFGASLAAYAVETGILGLQDLPALGLRTEEMQVQPGSTVVGQTLTDLAAREPDLLLLGLRRDTGLAKWHEVDGPIAVGDVVIALGSPDALRRLSGRLAALPTR